MKIILKTVPRRGGSFTKLTRYPPHQQKKKRRRREKKLPPGKASSPVSDHSTPHHSAPTKTTKKQAPIRPWGGHRKAKCRRWSKLGLSDSGWWCASTGLQQSRQLVWHFLHFVKSSSTGSSWTSNSTSGISPFSILLFIFVVFSFFKESLCFFPFFFFFRSWNFQDSSFLSNHFKIWIYF